MIKTECRTAAGAMLCYGSRAAEHRATPRNTPSGTGKQKRPRHNMCRERNRSSLLMFGSETGISHADADIF